MNNLRKAAFYALVAILAGLAAIHQACAQQDVITTVAGGSGPNGIPGTDAVITNPFEVAVDAQGNFYFAARGQNQVFKVNSAGIITIVAGTGVAGYSGDGALAVNAELYAPYGVAVDGANPANVYISDSNNCLVRKVTAATGIITTIAGLVTTPTTGNPYSTCGYSGDGGLADKAELNLPLGLAVNPKTGDLYVADYYNGRVRKVAGGSPTGTISTFAGGGGGVGAANCGGSAPYGDGSAATAAYLCYPQGVALDSTVSPVNIFVSESSTGRRCTVREVAGANGDIYRLAGTYGSCGFADDEAATSALMNNPWQVDVSVSGGTTTVRVVDYGNQRIRQFPVTYKAGVPQPGTITTVAGSGQAGYCGDGGLATSACLYDPIGVASDSSGDFYIGDYVNNRVRKVTKSSGDISTVVGWVNRSYSSPVGVTNAPATGLQLYQPVGAFLDQTSGNLYIAGYEDPAVYEVNPSTGIANTIAGNGVAGFAGDGTNANNAGTELNLPQYVVKDANGNLYISDYGNCAIREVIASSGDITTIAGGSEGHLNGCGYSGDTGLATKAQLYNPAGMVVDGNDNLYVADYSNCVVRKIALGSGIITTVAGDHTCQYRGDGGPATLAALNGPDQVAIDGLGDLFISELSGERIRKVDGIFGFISTVAGDGAPGYTGDGLATANSLYEPGGVFADTNGNFFISDQVNDLLRWVDPAGTMVSFAGTPQRNGFGGDGGPATSALLEYPQRLSRDVAGNTYFADYYNNRVRKVTAFAGYGRSTAELNFTKQQVGTTSEFQPITLSAIGPITVSGITLPAGFAETDDCIGNALTTGETCEIDVTFTPAKAGITDGMLTIASNAYFNGAGGLSAQGNTVDLVGEGGGLSISGSLTFPTQLVGPTSTQTVTLQNTGNQVKLDSISFPGPTNFSVAGGTCAAGNTLNSGASCTITLAFKPYSGGLKKGTLTIASSDPASPLLAAVSGTATTLTVSPTSLAFGSVIDGETKTLDLTVTNSSEPFAITPNIAGAGFTILSTGNTCGGTLAAGKSCTLPVQFAPTAIQSYSGTLTLVSGNSYSPTVPLTGTGSTNISVSPTSISFTTITHGTKEASNLTLKNLGATTLSLATSFSGTGAAAYSIATTGNTCGTSLAAGAACALPVQFAPAAAQSYSASLLITTKGGTNPTVPLTGTGK